MQQNAVPFLPYPGHVHNRGGVCRKKPCNHFWAALLLIEGRGSEIVTGNVGK